MSCSATGDGKHLVAQSESTSDAGASRLLVASLDGLPRLPSGALNLTAYSLARGVDAEPLPWQSLPTHGGYEFQFVAGYGDDLYFLTTWGAPRYRVVRARLGADGSMDPADYEVVVPEHERDLLQAVGPTLGPDGQPALVLTYLHDVKGALRVVHAADGSPLADVPLPGPGSVSASSDRTSSAVFFKFASFTTPGSIYRWDAAKPTAPPTLWREAHVNGVDLAKYETKQVFLPSKDGRANIPLFITAAKNTTLDGSNPTTLYGYGGFNIVNGVEFQPDVLVGCRGGGWGGRGKRVAGWGGEAVAWLALRLRPAPPPPSPHPTSPRPRLPAPRLLAPHLPAQRAGRSPTSLTPPNPPPPPPTPPPPKSPSRSRPPPTAPSTPPAPCGAVASTVNAGTRTAWSRTSKTRSTTL